MSTITVIIAVWISFVGFTYGYPSNTEKLITKRELPLITDDYSSGGPWLNGAKSNDISSNFVANAIAAAQQATANVLIAQQQVQAAKEHVLNQQRIAMEKEAAAAIQAQKSEAAAAIQRSQAAAAVEAVILAQQRLAAAKAAVANKQRIAAAKEAEAAAALSNSANAAAANIRKTENEATKLANLQRAGVAAAAFQVSAAKDAALAPITAGNNHVSSLNLAWPSYYGSYLSASGPWSTGPVSSYFTPSKTTLSLNPVWK